jgi:uncharacterized membrane protein YbhN (UPF0104 family)
MTELIEPVYSGSSHKVSVVLIILSLLITLSLIFLFATQFDLSKTFSTWQTLSSQWLMLCLVLVFSSSIARAGRLYHHFHNEIKGQFGLCLRISLHHNFFNNLLPLRIGEASFPLLLRQKFGIEITKSTAALLSFRLVDLSVLTFIGILTLLLGLHLTAHLTLLLIVFLVTVLVGLLLSLLTVKLAHHWPKLAAPLSKIKDGLPRTRSNLFRLILWTILIWTIKLLSYAFILQAFTDSIIPLSLLAALSGELASIIPLYTPAALGSFEGGILTVLIPAGISQSTALTAAINLHLFLLLTTLCSAGFGLMLGNNRHDTR